MARLSLRRPSFPLIAQPSTGSGSVCVAEPALSSGVMRVGGPIGAPSRPESPRTARSCKGAVSVLRQGCPGRRLVRQPGDLLNRLGPSLRPPRPGLARPGLPSPAVTRRDPLQTLSLKTEPRQNP